VLIPDRRRNVSDSALSEFFTKDVLGRGNHYLPNFPLCPVVSPLSLIFAQSMKAYTAPQTLSNLQFVLFFPFFVHPSFSSPTRFYVFLPHPCFCLFLSPVCLLGYVTVHITAMMHAHYSEDHRCIAQVRLRTTGLLKTWSEYKAGSK